VNASQRQQDGFATAGRVPPGLLAWQVYFLAYVAGIWGIAHPEPAFFVAALLALGLVAFRRPGLAPSLVCLALIAGCFALGQTHARLLLPETPRLPPALEQGGKALVRGRVAEVTDKAYGRLEIVLEDVSAAFERPRSEQAAAQGASPDEDAEGAPPVEVAMPGRIAWDWDQPGYRPAPGQTVAATLRLRPVHGFANFGGGDFEWRQRLRGIFVRCYTRGEGIGADWGARPRAFWWDLREDLRARLLSLLPEGQGAAIVLGLLLGDRSRIGQDVAEELRAAGLSHTLALSGLNVVYVAVLGLGLAWVLGLLFPRVFLRIPRQKLAILFSFPLVAAYVWLGQASPSLVRSAWMFGFWGLLMLLDRGRALLDGLFLALLLIVVLDPLCVFDVSLEMSAVAVAGMAVLYPWLVGMLPKGRSLPGRAAFCVWEAFSLTLCANLALLPVTVWYFGTYPPNFLLNLPWLPVQGLVVQVLAMAGLALAPVPGLEGVAGWLLHAAAWTQDWMLVALHRLVIAGCFPTWALLRPLWPELLGAGAVLCAAPFCWPNPRAWTRTVALCLLFAGLLLMAWPQAQTLCDDAADEVRLTVLDVGQSQAVLVTAPGGRRVLIDAGGAMSGTFDMGRSVVGPALAWGRAPRLEAALFSHPDADHAQGLAWILRQFEVGLFLTNGAWPAGALGRELDAALREGVGAGRLAPEPCAAGDVLDLGSGVELQAVHPAQDYEGRNANDNSLVLRLVWRGVPLALLPGDVQRDGIEDMIGRGRDLRAQVLLLPHHGSKSSLSGMLYEAVSPRQALVSCGYQNMYHFPNRDVVAELSGRGIPLAATSERGMIEVLWRTPGGEFSLRAARP